MSNQELRKGWLCPACGGAHGPDVKTCPVQEVPAPSVADLVETASNFPCVICNGLHKGACP